MPMYNRTSKSGGSQCYETPLYASSLSPRRAGLDCVRVWGGLPVALCGPAHGSSHSRQAAWRAKRSMRQTRSVESRRGRWEQTAWHNLPQLEDGVQCFREGLQPRSDGPSGECFDSTLKGRAINEFGIGHQYSTGHDHHGMDTLFVDECMERRWSILS
jgi:hypothetical protein